MSENRMGDFLTHTVDTRSMSSPGGCDVIWRTNIFLCRFSRIFLSKIKKFAPTVKAFSSQWHKYHITTKRHTGIFKTQ